MEEKLCKYFGGETKVSSFILGDKNDPTTNPVTGLKVSEYSIVDMPIFVCTYKKEECKCDTDVKFRAFVLYDRYCMYRMSI